ncbi:MAG: hypothetical protein HY847_11895 [Betaproteobacteria bacterium]|nr:hypothetical protein [Betaproteobacteria bacterium]
MSTENITKSDIVGKLFNLAATAAAARALLDEQVNENPREKFPASRAIDQIADLAHDLACEIDNSDIAAD